MSAAEKQACTQLTRPMRLNRPAVELALVLLCVYSNISSPSSNNVAMSFYNSAAHKPVALVVCDISAMFQVLMLFSPPSPPSQLAPSSVYHLVNCLHSSTLCLLPPSPSLQCDSEGRTAVHYAAFFGHHRSLQFLIDFACDWSPRDSLGRVPLHWAVVPPSTKCLGILLKHVQ